MQESILVDSILAEIQRYLLIALSLILSTALIMIALLCDFIRKKLRQKLELDIHIKERELLDIIVTSAVSAVEEAHMIDEKEKSKGMSSTQKEDMAIEIIRREAARRGLGNPIPIDELRNRVKAKVHELYHS